MMALVRRYLMWGHILCLLIVCPSGYSKKCCDSECTQPISYGRTVSRYITRETGFLSYPASALVTVFSKDVTVHGVEMWEAEIQGKKGFIRPAAINELTFKCMPNDVDSNPSDESTTVVAGTTLTEYLEATPLPSSPDTAKEVEPNTEAPTEDRGGGTTVDSTPSLDSGSDSNEEQDGGIGKLTPSGTAGSRNDEVDELGNEKEDDGDLTELEDDNLDEDDVDDDVDDESEEDMDDPRDDEVDQQDDDVDLPDDELDRQDDKFDRREDEFDRRDDKFDRRDEDFDRRDDEDDEIDQEDDRGIDGVNYEEQVDSKSHHEGEGIRKDVPVSVNDGEMRGDSDHYQDASTEGKRTEESQEGPKSQHQEGQHQEMARENSDKQNEDNADMAGGIGEMKYDGHQEHVNTFKEPGGNLPKVEMNGSEETVSDETTDQIDGFDEILSPELPIKDNLENSLEGGDHDTNTHGEPASTVVSTSEGLKSDDHNNEVGENIEEIQNNSNVRELLNEQEEGSLKQPEQLGSNGEDHPDELSEEGGNMETNTSMAVDAGEIDHSNEYGAEERREELEKEPREHVEPYQSEEDGQNKEIEQQQLTEEEHKEKIEQYQMEYEERKKQIEQQQLEEYERKKQIEQQKWEEEERKKQLDQQQWEEEERRKQKEEEERRKQKEEEEREKQMEEERKKQIEQHPLEEEGRNKQMDQQQLEEEEERKKRKDQQQLEEEDRRKQKEENREQIEVPMGTEQQQWEEEKLKKQIEQQQWEEEQKKQIEEQYKQQEDQQKNQLEEIKRKLEEERNKQLEEVRNKQLEEERNKQLEEERNKQLEEERNKQLEEERNEPMEEERKKELEEERKKELEEERKKELEEERNKQLEEERNKQLEEERNEPMEEERKKELEEERKKELEEERNEPMEEERNKQLEEERNEPMEEERKKELEEERNKQLEEERNEPMEEERKKELEEERNEQLEDERNEQLEGERQRQELRQKQVEEEEKKAQEEEKRSEEKRRGEEILKKWKDEQQEIIRREREQEKKRQEEQKIEQEEKSAEGAEIQNSSYEQEHSQVALGSEHEKDDSEEQIEDEIDHSNEDLSGPPDMDERSESSEADSDKSNSYFTESFKSSEEDIGRGDETCDMSSCKSEAVLPYNCHKDHIPLPWSQDSVISYVIETVRVTVKDGVFAILPTPLASWICQNRTAIGMLVAALMSIHLMLPILALLGISVRSSRNKSLELKSEIAQRVDATHKLNDAEAARKKLVKQVEDLHSNGQMAEENTRRLHGELEELRQEKVNLEVHNQTITYSLQQTQLSVEQYLQDSEQLRSQLALLQQQQSAVMEDKAHVVEDNKMLGAQVAELQVTVQGLEATKEQLEADRYTAQTSLNELEKDHQQVLVEMKSMESNSKSLVEDVAALKTSLEQEQQVAAERGGSGHSAPLLLQVTQDEKEQVDYEGEGGVAGEGVVKEGVAEEGSNGEVAEEEEGEDEKGKKRNAQLMRIEALLNTTKLQVELQEAEQQRDTLLSNLQTTQSQLGVANGDNGALRDRVNHLEQELRETSESRNKLEMKMAAITEYFQKKEMDLHSKLEVGEQARRKIEGFANEAEDKDRARAEERVKEKEQLEQLRQQMKDLELSYVTQVKNHEKRATEATTQLKRVEQELRQSNREVTLYKKRLSELESLPPSAKPSSGPSPVPPSGPPSWPQDEQPNGPPTGPPTSTPTGPQPAGSRVFQDRPISAPRMDPRTSSPAHSVTSTGPGVPGESGRDLLNMSQPVRSSSELSVRPSSAVNMSLDEAMSNKPRQRSVVTPDPNMPPRAANGPLVADPRGPPSAAPYQQWPPHRPPMYRPGSFYPPPPPMYRGFYPPRARPMPPPPPSSHPRGYGPTPPPQRAHGPTPPPQRSHGPTPPPGHLREGAPPMRPVPVSSQPVGGRPEPARPAFSQPGQYRPGPMAPPRGPYPPPSMAPYGQVPRAPGMTRVNAVEPAGTQAHSQAPQPSAHLDV